MNRNGSAADFRIRCVVNIRGGQGPDAVGTLHPHVMVWRAGSNLIGKLVRAQGQSFSGHFRYWHLADIDISANVRFAPKGVIIDDHSTKPIRPRTNRKTILFSVPAEKLKRETIPS